MEGLDGFTHMSGTLEGTEGGANLGLLIREPVHVPPRFVGLFFFFGSSVSGENFLRVPGASCRVS